MASKRKTISTLLEWGLPEGLAHLAYITFGTHVLRVLTENPYELLGLDDKSAWAAAEQLANSNQMGPDHPRRVEGAIRFVLQQSTRNGHIYLPEWELRQQLYKSLDSFDEMMISEALETLADRHCISLSVDEEENSRVYLEPLRQAEAWVAQRLHEIEQAPSSMGMTALTSADIHALEERMGVEFADTQREAVLSSFLHKIMIITGGPGTGKTTILKSVITLFREREARVWLAAPTGRAARKLAESTGHKAFTIHRLLEYNPETRKFNRHEGRPVRGDLLIVDEASMIDIELMAQLLKAVTPSMHLMLVGDVDQLPSVGPGAVLNDIISSGCFKTFRLTDIFRQKKGSLISLNAKRINEGEMPEIDGLGLDSGQDFFFINRPESERAEDTVLDMIQTRIPEQFGFSPARDIQLVSPMIRRALGVETFNQRLQALLNPQAASAKRRGPIHVGDKVMQIRNDYKKDVFNGDIGFVESIQSKPWRMHIQFEGRLVEYSREELDSITLAYAITVHKSQGSEYPAIILPLTKQHYPMLQRNLLYTAVSRGKELVVIVGDTRALEQAVRNNKVQFRYSHLRERLLQAGQSTQIAPTPDGIE